MRTFADKFLDDYFAEADEHLAAIRPALLSLENSVGRSRPDAAIVEELFRAYHSIKGLAGMVEDRESEALAHELESYLGALRDGDAALSSTSVDALIDGTQCLERAVAARRHREPVPESASALARLRQVTSERSGPGLIHGSIIAPGGLDAPPWVCMFTPSPALSARGINVNEVRARLSERGEIRSAVPQVSGDRGVVFRFVFSGPLDDATAVMWQADGMLCAPEIVPVTGAAEAADSSGRADEPAGRSAHYVRVDLARLDDLMRMIGDMVIRRARLNDALARVESHVPAAEWRNVQENAAALERQLRDLRDGVMRVRLVPVGEIFRRMPFVVRDLARESDRRVHVAITGQETQIDKFLVERMMDPVLHLVRNAVSHGIESSEARTAAGKSPDGTISLSAHAAGEIVTLVIADDGRGVVPERILARAASLGLPVPATSEADDATLLELLCSPGFSTRDAADHASGRGFGMAVVRKTVQELGGTLAMTSAPGEGTSFSIDLPLTLAITDALIAAVGAETFAVPQSAVREVIEIEGGAIRRLEGGEVVPFRGRALPILRLSAVLGISVSDRTRHHALIVGSDAAAVGVLVDRVVSQREIVVRTTTDPLIRVDGVAGATDLGDGRAVLILDVAAVARAARGRADHRPPVSRGAA